MQHVVSASPSSSSSYYILSASAMSVYILFLLISFFFSYIFSIYAHVYNSPHSRTAAILFITITYYNIYSSVQFLYILSRGHSALYTCFVCVCVLLLSSRCFELFSYALTRQHYVSCCTAELPMFSSVRLCVHCVVLFFSEAQYRRIDASCAIM